MYNQKITATVENGELNLKCGIERLCTDVNPANWTLDFERQVTGEQYAQMVATYLNSRRDEGEAPTPADPENNVLGDEGRPPGPTRLEEFLNTAAEEAIAVCWSGPK